jgi:ABC-type multidrug transport system fused ATPase/permease subunit
LRGGQETTISLDSPYLSMATETPNYDQGGGDAFVKIGGALPDTSDPRTIKAGGAGARGATAASSRVFFLRIIDSRKWHYSEAFGIFLDFFVQLLAVSFTPKEGKVGHYFSEEVAAESSRYFSSGFMVCYLVDMVIRICGLRSALLRSHSNIADLLCVLGMGALLAGRYKLPKHEFDITLGYICLLALRLILKPRARTFSKKLHKFRANGDHIRISIESLRASLARIPGITALAIEMMETDLLIICGRDSGDMSRNELMSFLERALRYRPATLSATEFLAHLRDIDASSSSVAYGVFDVVRSTMSHWSNQVFDLFLCILVACVNASISPLMAYFQSRLSDAFETLSGQPDPDESVFRFGILGLLGLSVPFVIGDYAIGYFQSKMIAKATERVQSSLLAIILRQNTNFFAERSEGDLNNLFSSDVARVNSLWQSVFWNLLNPLIAVCFGFGYALYMKYPIGVMAFAFTAILLSSGPQGFAGLRSKEFASKNAYVAAEFQNAVGCQKVVRAYAIQEPLMERFKNMCATLRKAQFSKDFWSSIVQIYIESAMYIFTAIMTAALAMKVWNGNTYPNDRIKAGEFFGFMTLLQRVSNPVTTLGGFMRVAIGNASSLQRLDDIIVGLGATSASDNDSDKNLPSLPKMQKDLRVEKLVFKYDKSTEKYILNELSATVPRGSYTCIVGPSGCGKSTLLACLMQFQEADGGAIRIDGHDIFNFSKTSFMNQMAVVFQDGGILNGTIYDNIRYGNTTATDAECEEAAHLAECHFIRDLKDGYNTIVGQHATANLSGGQAQRLCLARALCRKPSLLLLDEATSALDPETEASIVSTLERLSSKMNMTILSVTHRLSTAVNADLILVLNQGRVAEEGRYEELVRKGGLFSEMVNKTDDHSDDDDAAAPQLKKKSVALLAPASIRHTSIEAARDNATDMGDSTLALQQFTKSLSTRVVNDVETARATGVSWYRYGNRNSTRVRKPSDDRASRRSGNSSQMEWEGGQNRRQTQGEDKYFVL